MSDPTPPDRASRLRGLTVAITDAVLERGRKSASGEILVIDRRNLEDVIEAALVREPPEAGEPRESQVTRLEVVDEDGRQYTRWRCHIDLSYQDDGRTLKVFVKGQSAVPVEGERPAPCAHDGVRLIDWNHHEKVGYICGLCYAKLPLDGVSVPAPATVPETPPAEEPKR